MDGTKKLEWVAFTRRVITFGEDMHGDTVTREAVIKSYRNLAETPINYMHDQASGPVGSVDKVWEDNCGIMIEGRVREDLKEKGEFGCGGRVMRTVSGKMMEWRLEEVSWIRTPGEVVAELREKLARAEKVSRVSHSLRSLEAPGQGAAVPEDLDRRIKDLRHELDVALMEWGAGTGQVSS